MDPFSIAVIGDVFGSGTGGTAAASASGTTSAGGILSGLNLNGIFDGIFKGIACIGNKAYNQNDVEDHYSRIRNGVNECKTVQDFENVINDLALLSSRKGIILGYLQNPCSKDNLNLIINYIDQVRQSLLSLVDYRDMGTGSWTYKKFIWYEKDWGRNGTIQLVSVTGIKGKTTDPSFPINGGVGQNEYQPTPTPDNGTYYTKDEVDSMLSSSNVSNLATSDVSTLQQLQTMLNAKPNCRGGIVNGKPYLDCSVTNDNTQNVIQIAGLALTALGLVWMMTKKK
ncbi:hypothetical protein FCL53_00045 [Elizabethkingia meningoseptica]|uniref:hypothetical protein n=1 Tax=Elizabethkingia meningoseptica TaxID=238 RepID=UPI001365B4CA|nr:hypothetical protein [Elizabethkingia meningoseptica]MVW90354.1 hypothetical protein [Elizabethkingia meningoseptica]